MFGELSGPLAWLLERAEREAIGLGVVGCVGSPKERVEALSVPGIGYAKSRDFPVWIVVAATQACAVALRVGPPAEGPARRAFVLAPQAVRVCARASTDGRAHGVPV